MIKFGCICVIYYSQFGILLCYFMFKTYTYKYIFHIQIIQTHIHNIYIYIYNTYLIRFKKKKSNRKRLLIHLKRIKEIPIKKVKNRAKESPKQLYYNQ